MGSSPDAPARPRALSSVPDHEHGSPLTKPRGHIMEQPEENADVVRRGYAAFNSADIKTLTN